MESLLGIVVEEGDRYHRISSFMMKVLKRVTGNDHDLVYKVSSSIRRTHGSLYDLGDLVVDPDRNIDKEHVSGVIQGYRSKIINELNELHDNLSTDSSNTTTKQMIKDYIVAFEGGVDNELPVDDDDLAKKLHKSEGLQMMILLNYAPIKKNSSTIISKKSDDAMITNKRQWFSIEEQLQPSRRLKTSKYFYQEDEDDLDTWDCGADSMTPCST